MTELEEIHFQRCCRLRSHRCSLPGARQITALVVPAITRPIFWAMSIYHGVAGGGVIREDKKLRVIIPIWLWN